MDMSDKDDQRYLQLAIQTIIHKNRHNFNLGTHSQQNPLFIKDISKEIVSVANRFKQITEYSMENLYCHSEH